jgi:ribosomal-protein-alanine N-acetyltransferase
VISVRKACPEDVSPVYAIEIEVTPNPWKERYFRDELENPLSFFYVAIDGSSGAIMGFIVFWLIDQQMELHNIAVSGAAQRRGVARELMKIMMQIASECEVHEIFLEVRASNKPAISLYEKFGFVSNGLRKNYYSNPSEDAILYKYNFI